MNDKVRLVRLYGWLGKRFGREHRLAVASPAEAVGVVRPVAGLRAGLAGQ